ncbi:Aliphatic acid kinase, short-chain [Cordyceps fumosorosea ARSEF 2679]|uniref:Aliphatic acid kinase, short-chain n=1 Tax=Cordyceps fumosorosea (strain ARSEF 2679) TaxID=1081104 RepID=A0A167PKK9_CORFA|nr:Aliphatic acid kinase, short-chain [Cordyceps fumosorosea ARSEF 2679]OAA56756.1 Aliphatic acid kinase, short-chain [Cordyceps fumosorosea ARSEF 2679]
MGLTPVSGLPGATRSGSIDPSLVFHYTNSAGKLSSSSTKDLHISRAEEILNKESGWAVLAGTRDFAAIAASNDAQKKLAFELFVDRVCAFVGSYYVSLRGNVDALVFAGGIGEKSAQLRSAILEGVACLGFSLNKHANQRKMSQTIEEITGPDARHRILVCQTDEQLEMVRLCSRRLGA